MSLEVSKEIYLQFSALVAIFTIFAPYELQMINPTFFFRYLKGRCHGNQFCGKITYPLALIALAFRHGMG